MQSEIVISSPTRVDLAGGTLDMWPLFNFVGGAKTVNVAIDVYSVVQLRGIAGKEITIDSKDLGYAKTFADLESLLISTDSQLTLYKPLLSFFKPQNGFHLVTKSQSPVGGGLGGSSSLVISMMKAFYQFLNQPLPSSHQVVDIAHNMEAQILNTPTGTQDYYPAFSGGLNILDYSVKGIVQKVIPVRSTPMKEHFLLVYTGRSHHSGINNFEVLKSAVGKDTKVMGALQNLKEVATKTAELCLNGEWKKLPEIFEQEYTYRIQLTEHFSSPEIRQIKEISQKIGQSQVKICGAGGGGCVLVWTAPEVRSSIIKECQTQGFQILNSQPVDLASTGS
ncbi:MAG: galactokinase [Bdellovibrionaceae bacterium]|nr:galactokinase [Pseudobdellovibrionaceae bacterium]